MVGWRIKPRPAACARWVCEGITFSSTRLVPPSKGVGIHECCQPQSTAMPLPRSIYRYRPGQRFGRHVDDSNDLPGGRFTQYTVLIYLSSCGGGETVFYGEPLAGSA